MKKVLCFNTVIVFLFWITGSVYEAGSGNSPGAVLALGRMLPFIISVYASAVICSCVYSLIYCIKKRSLNMLIPITVFLIGIGSYFLFADADSFWLRVMAHCFRSI